MDLEVHDDNSGNSNHSCDKTVESVPREESIKRKLNEEFPWLIFDKNNETWRGWILQCTETGIIKMQDILKEKNPKKFEETTTKGKYNCLCLLCLNEGKTIEKCMQRFISSQGGNLNSHLKEVHNKKVINGIVGRLNQDDIPNVEGVFNLSARVPAITNYLVHSAEHIQPLSFRQTLLKFLILKGLPMDIFDCDVFQDILEAYKSEPNAKVFSRWEAPNLINEEKNLFINKIKENLSKTIIWMKGLGSNCFLCIQHDVVKFMHIYFVSGYLTYIDFNMKMHRVPLSISPVRCKDLQDELNGKSGKCAIDLANVIKQNVEQYVPMSYVLFSISDNEPCALKTSQMLTEEVKKIRDLTLCDDEQNVDDDMLSLNDVVLFGGCISHQIHNAICYSLSLKVGKVFVQSNSITSTSLLVHGKDDNSNDDNNENEVSIRIPPASQEASKLLKYCKDVNEFSLAPNIRKSIEATANSLKKQVLQPTLVNQTRWNSSFKCLNCFIYNYSVWSSNPEIIERFGDIRKISLEAFQEISAILLPLKHLSELSELKSTPLSGWVAPLTCATLIKYGIDLFADGAAGVHTTYKQLLNKKKNTIDSNFRINESEINFLIGDTYRSVSCMHADAKCFFWNISQHLCYRFINKPINSVYLHCLVVHPYAKMLLDIVFSHEDPKLILQEAIEIYLPNRQTSNEKQATSTNNNEYKLKVSKKVEIRSEDVDELKKWLEFTPPDANIELTLSSIMSGVKKYDSLLFWKEKRMVASFPTIAALNAVLSSIDISSSSTESLFSTLKNTISDKRASINLDTLSDLVVLRQAYQAEVQQKNQQRKKREHEAEEDEE